MKREPIPTHEFYDKLERTIPFDLVLLKEKGSYDPSEHHRHAYYEIFFFVKGGGTHEVDFEVFPIESNSLHFVSPGQTHVVKRALNSNGYVILFSREFYHFGINNKDILYELPFLNNNTNKPILNLSDTEVSFFKDVVQKIQTEYASSNSDKEEILRSYLHIILIHAKRLFHKTEVSEQNSSRDLVNKFRIAVEKNFMNIHKVSEYADMLSVSSGHLNDTIQKTIGRSTSDLIHERLILEAKRLLLHSDESVSEIAYTLNFEDASYFTRFFRKHSDISPSEFRIQIREKYR